MRVAIYARVSTRDKGQDPENQVHQLRAFAEQHGTLYKVFTEEVSGGKSDRAAFKQLLLEAYQKKFDLVVFWRLDRFSREGALPTLKYLKELRDHGVNYKSFTETLPRFPWALWRRHRINARHHRCPRPHQD